MRRERAILRSVFQRALLLAAATGAACAESCSNSGGGEPDGGAANARGLDAMPPSGDGAAGDAGVTGDGYAWPPGCAPSPPVVYDAAADAPGCALRTRLPCGIPPFVTSIDPVGCVLPLESCSQLCTGIASPFLSCEVANGFGCDLEAGAFVAADGAPVVIECDKCTIAGRRPAALKRADVRARDAVARYLACTAHLEAASVPAFERLALELAAFDAPGELVRAARRSARDETRHARRMTSLARDHGTERPAVRIGRTRPRSAARLARENSVEGCVLETFGALLAAWQADHARDRAFARTMRRIAADEARHAALAWSIAAWLEPKLDAASWTAVRYAKRRAVASLKRAWSRSHPEPLASWAGLPSVESAAALIAHLDACLWKT